MLSRCSGNKCNYYKQFRVSQRTTHFETFRYKTIYQYQEVEYRTVRTQRFTLVTWHVPKLDCKLKTIHYETVITRRYDSETITLAVSGLQALHPLKPLQKQTQLQTQLLTLPTLLM